MADDIRSRAGLPPGEEAARRRAAGEASRAAAREALTQEQMRERTAREMEERRAARPATPAPEPGPGRIPPPPRPSTVSQMRSDITRPPSPGTTARVGKAGAGLAGAAIMAPGALSEMADVGRRRLDARDEAARQRREQYMERRRQEATDERSAMEQEMGEAGSRMPTPRPVRAAPTPARRAAPARRREMTADELNALSLGEGGRGPEAELARMRMEQRRRELEEKGTAFKKGGYVKPKAAPKKMMRGGAVAKPKPAAATKPKAKPMPFKKGGVIKKGRK